MIFMQQKHVDFKTAYQNMDKFYDNFLNQIEQTLGRRRSQKFIQLVE